MEREILFKAKRVDNGEWIEGDLLHNYCVEYNKFYKTAIRYSINGIYSFPIEVHPETVCQFTGLLDKNGNKIFEGDKCKATQYGDDLESLIVFHKGAFICDYGKYGKYNVSDRLVYGIEITGSIHDK